MLLIVVMDNIDHLKSKLLSLFTFMGQMEENLEAAKFYRNNDYQTSLN